MRFYALLWQTPIVFLVEFIDKLFSGVMY